MDRIELMAEFILQSDLIEGIRDDRAELEAQLCAEKCDGHVGALLFLSRIMRCRFLLAQEHLKEVQRLITAEQGIKRLDLKLPAKYIGEYRDIPRGVDGEARIDPQQLGVHMHGLMVRIRYWQERAHRRPEMENIAELADFYFDFEKIHPFFDGNGRTGRVMVFAFMEFLGREPFIFRDEEKYWMHFPSLKSGNREVMRKYFYEKSGLI